MQGTSKSAGQEGQRLTKVDRSDEIIKPVTVGQDLGKIIAARRQAMDPKMTQSDLSKKILEPARVVADFEKGTAKIDQNVLRKMERALGIKLTGSNIGGPLFPPKTPKADATKGAKK